MKYILKRLFIKLPLYIIFFITIFTIFIPLLYWVITGDDYTEILQDYLDDL
jgi:hypothetical protein